MTRTPPMVPPMQLLPIHGTTELEVVTPRRTLDDLQLAPATRGAIHRVLDEQEHAKKLTGLSLRPANRLLFCGPPGCGKTMAAGALALALGVPLARLKMEATVSSYMGETSKHLRNAFDAAGNRRMVVLVDEIDAVARRRSVSDQAASTETESGRVVCSLLSMLEDARDRPAIFVAATNLHGVLDPAIWRRFDDVLMFPRPTQSEAQALLKSILATYGQNPVMWRWPSWFKDVSYADVERVATDAIKAVTIDRSVTIDRALREAVDRQEDRRALTGATKARRKP